MLYAEDNPDDADLTRAQFQEDVPEFELHVEQTGAGCLVRLREQPYDLLLLDHRLPDMDSLEVLRHLAAQGDPLPVVLTTSAGDEELAVRALQLGACDYVPKSGNYLQRLPAVLSNAIEEHRARRATGPGLRVERRILYAERHRDDVDLTIAHLAEVAPYLRVEVVTSAGQALSLLAEGAYDLVLADLRLPGMNALDMLKEAKARGLRVPFIVVTGGGDETAAVAAVKLGAYDYVVKRDDYLTRLPVTIEHAIARFQLRETNTRLQEELAERQRLQQSTSEALALLDALQRHAPVGIAFLDREYRFQRVNDALATINGCAVASHIGRTVDDVAPQMSPHIEALYRRARDGDAVLNVDVPASASPTGEAGRHLIVSVYPVRGNTGEVVGVGLTVADVTDRKLAENALREHAEAMADVSRQKDEFLALLSHELRNPLAPIRTAVELLRRRGAHDDMVTRAHEVIDRQVTHLARLISDLLDVARITSGRIDLEMQTLDLRRVVQDALEGTGDLLAARHHRLDTSLPSDPVPVRGDLTRLVQVVVNLLTNAAKYTSEGGTIGVSIAVERGEAVLRVRDTGVGIPARLVPKIFDLFTQDDRTLDRAQGGLGLGLTIVRRLTELHGGSVSVRSAGRGHGSEFTIRLPLEVRDGAAGARAPFPESRPTFPRRCLVVEDNVDAARMLELALTVEGHEVRLAFDGRDAVDVAAVFRPDVVVLDIGLPRMNGYDAARAIRGLPDGARVHIIGVTGYGQAADHERSRAAGFDTHLVKPVELEVLLRSIAEGRADSASG